MITSEKTKLKSLSQLETVNKIITTETYQDNLKNEELMVTQGKQRYYDNKERHERDTPSLHTPIATIFANAIPKGVEALKEKIEHDKAKPTSKPKYLTHIHGLKLEELVYQALSDAWRTSKRKDARPVTAAISIGQAVILQSLASAFTVRQSKQYKRLMNRAKKKYSNPKRKIDYFLYLLKSATKNDKLHLDDNDQPILDDEGNITHKSALYGHEELKSAVLLMSDESIPQEEKYDTQVGYPILQVVLNSCGIFQLDSNMTSRKTTKAEKAKTGRDSSWLTKDVLTITDEAALELDKMDKLLDWMKPRYRPVLYKPRPLGINKYMTSGYHSEGVSSTLSPVKKMKKLQKIAIEKAIETNDMNKFWKGLTNTQNVLWLVDNELWDDVIVPDVLANRKAGDKFPHIFGMKLRTPEEFSEHKGIVAPKLWEDEHHILYSKYKNDVEKYNRIAKSNKVVFKQDCDAAHFYKNKPFYLTVQPDSRGRSYYIPHFNPQREDRMGAVFSFGEFKPLGEDGMISIAAHLANCGSFEYGENVYGIPPKTKVDKVIEEYKVAWVNTNWHWIHDTVEDFKKGSHLKHSKWRQADKPYHFLKAAKEYFRAIKFKEEGGNLEDFMSNLPCALDSSSSGIQIYACMLRSYADAFISNLVYKEGQILANDVYSLIANAVDKIIDKHLIEYSEFEEGVEAEKYKWAKIWKAFGVSRKVVKRPIMTSLYSATLGGHTIMIFEDTIEPQTFKVLEEEIDENPFGDSQQHYKVASYLARLINEAIDEELSEPRKAMQTLQKLAEVMANEGKSVKYITPAGFPFINEVYEEDSIKLDLYLTDAKLHLKRKQPTITFDTDEIDVDKSITKICPNFVHSLDSTLLVLAIIEFIRRGGTSILTNHDSFATHPSDVELLKTILLETRVEMFTKNRPLKDIIEYNKMMSDNPNLIPEAPAEGDFNLAEELPKAVFADS